MSLIRYKLLTKLFYPRRALKSILIKKICLPISTFLLLYIFIEDVSNNINKIQILSCLALFSGVSTSIFNLINFSRLEKTTEIIQLMIAAPISMVRILIERAVLVSVEAIVSTNINFVVLSLFFDIQIASFLNITVQMILILYITQFAILGCLFIIMTIYINNINLLLNILLSTIQIFSGAFFPISVFGKVGSKILLYMPLVNLMTWYKHELKINIGFLDLQVIFIEVIKVVIMLLLLIISNRVIVKKALKSGTILVQ